jgi:hypothetical protein
MIALCAIAWLGTSAVAAGQEARTYVGGSFMWSTQDPAAAAACQSSGCAKPGVGGSAWGVTGELGWFVQPAVSVAAEISVPARFETIQASAIPNQVYDNNYRDLAVSGLVHFHAPTLGRIRVALVGGGGLVQESVEYRTAEAPFQSPNYGPYGPEQTLTRMTWELVAGGDVELRVARHVSIVPQVRLHWIGRAAIGDSTGRLALGSVVWRPAIGVRASF